MFRKIGSWFSGLSKVGKAGVILASLFVVGVAAAGPSKPTSPSQPSPSVQSTPQTKSDITEKKTITETQPIPFQKTTVQDSNLEKGKTTLRTVGVNGVKTLTYEITLTNDSQTDKKLVKEEVTTQPINEVTAIGTKVVVVTPPPSNTIQQTPTTNMESPTAKCRDGTYSYSQNRSGTCSHHGGVAIWY